MPSAEVFVTLGVDTHKDIHVAVALDQLGRWLDATEIETTPAGYAQLLAWASQLGTVDQVGIEGTGSHGAGLCRWLTARGIIVVEVERPDRRLRRNKGKSDTIDAEAAARKVLSGEATVVPKSADGNVERIRVLRVARRSAVVAQGQAANQIHALVTTAPEELREQLRDLTTRKRVAKAARFRPGRNPDTPLTATKLALKTLAAGSASSTNRSRPSTGRSPAWSRRPLRTIVRGADRHLPARGILRTTQETSAQPWRGPRRKRRAAHDRGQPG